MQGAYRGEMGKKELDLTPQDRGLLGACLWAARKALGWSLREAEEKSRVSNAYVSQIENGSMPKPSPGILLKLATAYKIPYQKLMELAGHIVPNASEKRAGALPTSPLVDMELTAKEEQEVREYLAFIRMRDRKNK